MLPEAKYIIYEEFINIDKNSENSLEYIDGIIYNQASPSKIHHVVAINLATDFNIFLKIKLVSLLSLLLMPY